jgi:nucleoside-diphosphate-sugar epimerase
VQDVADAFVTLLERDVVGIVNIASGSPVVIRDIVYKIAEKLNRNGLIQFSDASTLSDEPPLVVADVRRLSNQVGWSPRFDLDQGLDQTITWWEKRLFGKK